MSNSFENLEKNTDPQFEYHDLPREKGIEDLVWFFDRVGVAEIFNSEENIRSFVDSMDFQDFQDLIFRINGILTQQPPGKRGKYWEMRIGGEIGGIDTPQAKDKPELLKYLWERTKSLTAVQDVGLAAATGVNLVHPFVDGNGRTSRLMYELFANGYRGSDEDRERIKLVLEDTGGLDTHDLAVPPFLKHEAWARVAEENGGYPVSGGTSFGLMTAPMYETLPLVMSRDELTQDEKESLVEWVSSKGKEYEPQVQAILQVFRSTGRIQEILKEYRDDEGRLTRVVMDGKVISEKAGSSEIAMIAHEYDVAKRDYAQTVISLLTDPGEEGERIRARIKGGLSEG